MNVQGIQNNLIYSSAQEVSGKQNPGALDETSGIEDGKPSSPAKNEAPQDEYIPQDEAAKKPTGLYKVVPDENGNPKIHFDDPKKKPEDKKAENCTANTDQVDREIEKLKEKKARLEQQIRSADDPEKIKDLEKQLAQVESEYQQKNNDAYRRQNAVFSS